MEGPSGAPGLLSPHITEVGNDPRQDNSSKITQPATGTSRLLGQLSHFPELRVLPSIALQLAV